MSRAGTPKDNAVIESFFGKFKDILKSRKLWKADNLYSVIDQAIYYYNYIKPMRKLKGKPPVQFRIEQSA